MKNFHTYLIVLCAILPSGCAASKKTSVLIPPVGFTQEAEKDIAKECMQQARALAKIPLTEEEGQKIGDIETARFFESGGKGRTIFSDRYVLCFLQRDYRLVQYPAPLFSGSKCDQLKRYQMAGLESERIAYLCQTRFVDSHCAVCDAIK